MVPEPAVDVEEAAPAAANVAVDKAVLSEQAPSSTRAEGQSSRKKTYIVLGIVAVVVIGLAVGLGVGLSNKNYSDSGGTNVASSPSEDAGDTTPRPATDPPVPTEPSLELLCSEENGDDLEACRTACQDVTCCFDMFVTAPCVESLPSGTSCDDFEPCSILYEIENVEAPTDQVQEVCNGPYNPDLTCEEACQPAACCEVLLGEESCYEGNEEICDLWIEAGCFNLGINEQDPSDGGGIPTEDTDGFIPGGEETDGDILGNEEAPGALQEPTSDVEAVCNGPFNPELTCEDVCQPAACCDFLMEDSCYLENEPVCDKWILAGCFNIASNAADPQEP